MYRTKDYILAAILHCEPETLSMLDEIDYDMADIMYDVLNFRGKVDLSEILDATYYQGLYEIDEYIDFLKKHLRSMNLSQMKNTKRLKNCIFLMILKVNFTTAASILLRLLKMKTSI